MVRLAAAVVISDRCRRGHAVARAVPAGFEQVGGDRRGTHLVQYSPHREPFLLCSEQTPARAAQTGRKSGSDPAAARGPKVVFDLRRWPAVIAPARFAGRPRGLTPALPRSTVDCNCDCRLATADLPTEDCDWHILAHMLERATSPGRHAARRTTGGDGLRAWAGFRRRAADARQGRLAARSGLDGPHRPRPTGRRPDAADDAQRRHHRGSADLGVAPDHARLQHLHAARTPHVDDVVQPGLRSIVGWRFQRRAVGAGARLESTVFVGGTVPVQEYRTDGMLAAPRCMRSVASGYASRTHYFWASGGYQHFGERRGRPDGRQLLLQRCLWLSPAVSARRLSEAGPALLCRSCRRAHRPRACITGSSWSRAAAIPSWSGRRRCSSTSSTGSKPASSFPVYQQTNFQPEEKFRFGVNFTYFFWRK